MSSEAWIKADRLPQVKLRETINKAVRSARWVPTRPGSSELIDLWVATLTKSAELQQSAQDVLSDNGLDPADAKIQTLGSGGDERLRVQVPPQDTAVQQQVRQAFAERAGISDVEQVSVTSVGPTWGDEITRKAVRALVFFFIAVSLYISVRFEWRMAVGGLAAVAHDVGISVGVYSVFGFEVTPATVIAFLTILGYSVNDTVVVSDRIRENLRKYKRMPLDELLNLSINETLSRTILTGCTAIVVLIALLVFGGEVIRNFNFAMLLGVLVGTYSSIFIAAPLLGYLGVKREWTPATTPGPAGAARRANV